MMGRGSGGAARPAILLGGAMGNALSVARSLGRRGVPVYLLEDAPSSHSRYARRVHVSSAPSRKEAWARYLLGAESSPLHGAVLLACSDVGIELLIEHRAALTERFILDVSDVVAQRRLLDKLTTYEAAREAGVPTPLFWPAGGRDDVVARRGEYVYPLVVKPLSSHRFQAVFGDKFFRVEDFEGLLAAYDRASAHDLDVVLLEEIPGPDDQLCSYYTYIDERGEALADFTKRIIRRYPENRGLACYHVTDWNPEVRDLGLELFRHVGLRGVGNVEFKRDRRDGLLKVIECNARFTAGNPLLAACGYDLALFVYNRLAGVPQQQLKGREYAEGLHLWFPRQDLHALLELRAKGRLTVSRWLASLAHRQVVPFFSFDDPVPFVVESARVCDRAARAGVRRLQARRDGFVP
jgi:predicted ATP-grasp superfamily ATP-dependent carboligase